MVKEPIDFIPQKLILETKTTKESLEYIFIDMLKDIYWTEKYLLRTLPEIAKFIYNELLLEAIEQHIDAIYQQNHRIERCFELKKIKASGKKALAIECLINEVNDNIQIFELGHVRDALITNIIQKITHYQISAYGALKIIATALGNVECAILLRESKDDELRNDIILTNLAEKINQLAANMEEEEVD
jgi:ferritin-like metal-binding protein YciE